MAKKGKGRRTVQYNPKRNPTDFEAGAEAAQMYRRINVRPDRASFLRAFKQWKRAHGQDSSLAKFTNGFKSAAPEHWSRNPGAHDEGGRIIHETSKAKRREYGSEIWTRRKSHGNPLKKWTPATLNGARVRIRAVGKGLQVDLGKVGR